MFSIYVILLWLLLAVIKPTRKMAIALLPWLIFACCYDWMRLYPNYKANPIDVKDLFDAEKMLFGIHSTNGELIIPSQYILRYTCRIFLFMLDSCSFGIRHLSIFKRKQKRLYPILNYLPFC